MVSNFCVPSQYFPPCYLLVWPPCIQNLSPLTHSSPSPLRIILLHQPIPHSVTLCVQVIAVFLLHWEKCLHSCLQFTQLITNPILPVEFPWREKDEYYSPCESSVRLVCLDRGYVHSKPFLLGLDNIYIPAWKTCLAATSVYLSLSQTHTSRTVSYVWLHLLPNCSKINTTLGAHFQRHLSSGRLRINLQVKLTASWFAQGHQYYNTVFTELHARS